MTWKNWKYETKRIFTVYRILLHSIHISPSPKLKLDEYKRIGFVKHNNILYHAFIFAHNDSSFSLISYKNEHKGPL